MATGDDRGDMRFGGAVALAYVFVVLSPSVVAQDSCDRFDMSVLIPILNYPAGACVESSPPDGGCRDVAVSAGIRAWLDDGSGPATSNWCAGEYSDPEWNATDTIACEQEFLGDGAWSYGIMRGLVPQSDGGTFGGFPIAFTEFCYNAGVPRAEGGSTWYYERHVRWEAGAIVWSTHEGQRQTLGPEPHETMWQNSTRIATLPFGSWHSYSDSSGYAYCDFTFNELLGYPDNSCEPVGPPPTAPDWFLPE